MPLEGLTVFLDLCHGCGAASHRKVSCRLQDANVALMEKVAESEETLQLHQKALATLKRTNGMHSNIVATGCMFVDSPKNSVGMSIDHFIRQSSPVWVF